MSIERAISAFAGFCPVGVVMHKLGIRTEREQALSLDS